MKRKKKAKVQSLQLPQATVAFRDQAALSALNAIIMTTGINPGTVGWTPRGNVAAAWEYARLMTEARGGGAAPRKD